VERAEPVYVAGNDRAARVKTTKHQQKVQVWHPQKNLAGEFWESFELPLMQVPILQQKTLLKIHRQENGLLWLCVVQPEVGDEYQPLPSGVLSIQKKPSKSKTTKTAKMRKTTLPFSRQQICSEAAPRTVYLAEMLRLVEVPANQAPTLVPTKYSFSLTTTREVTETWIKSEKSVNQPVVSLERALLTV
jgi:hypothetical protein